MRKISAEKCLITNISQTKTTNCIIVLPCMFIRSFPIMCWFFVREYSIYCFPAELNPLNPKHSRLAKIKRQHCDKSFRKFAPHRNDLAVMSLCILIAFTFVAVVSHDYAAWSLEAKNVFECSKVATATNLSHESQRCRCDFTGIRNAIAVTLHLVSHYRLCNVVVTLQY